MRTSGQPRESMSTLRNHHYGKLRPMIKTFDGTTAVLPLVVAHEGPYDDRQRWYVDDATGSGVAGPFRSVAEADTEADRRNQPTEDKVTPPPNGD